MPEDGGRYVVCWCGLPFENGVSQCSQSATFENHNVLVGTIDVPDPTGTFKIRGSVCANFNSDLDADPLVTTSCCEGGMNCTVGLFGFGLSNNDRVAVMDGASTS
eukprot:5470705-Amphidinium_carterae.1